MKVGNWPYLPLMLAKSLDQSKLKIVVLAAEKSLAKLLYASPQNNEATSLGLVGLKSA